MDEKPDQKREDRDEPVKIDLDPDVALRALLEVDPEAPTSDHKPPRTRGKDTRVAEPSGRCATLAGP